MTTPTVAKHRLSLPGGAWEIWRWAVLRGAGFPAAAVQALGAPALAAAADRLLDLEAAAARCRRAALDLVSRTMDERRDDRGMESRELRAPLLKALYALAGGKLPRESPSPEIAAAVADLALADQRAAAARGEIAGAYAAAVAAVSEEVSRIAALPAFREAVTWQTRHAAETALVEVARPAGGRRDSRRRQQEELVASYLQRYAVKNDTIGFFGPVGWARLDDQGPLATVRPGPGLVSHRSVYFENWCIDALARRLSREAALRPWLAPRLRTAVGRARGELRSPGGPPLTLPPEEMRVLAACDGVRTAREIAGQLAAATAAPVPVDRTFEILAQLAATGIVTWALEAPLELRPEVRLRAALERIGAPPPAAPALPALAALEAGRQRVAAAAGAPPALAGRLRELDETFTRLTGEAPYRNPGQMYASRSLVYEDCRRDVEVAFGPELLRRLGPPLTLLLQSARWLTSEVARRVEQRLGLLFAAQRSRSRSETVPGYTFYLQGAAALRAAPRDPALVAAEEELQARWARVLGLDEAAGRERAIRRRTADVAERAEQAFGGAGPAWSLVHHHSPDLLLQAAGEEALRRGEVQAVLGEIHPSNTLSWSCFCSQHPAPGELLEAVAEDLCRLTVVVPQMPRNWPERTNVSLVLPHFHRFEVDDQPPGQPPCRTLPAGDVVIAERNGRLEAQTRDGAVRFPAIELFGLLLTQECSRILGRLLPRAPHRPRIALDDLVLARESWSFDESELGFAGIKDAAERFLAVRRWARQHGLPRFSFYKLPSERKPVFLDLDSPLYLDIFARLLRQDRTPAPEPRVVIAEMLPDFQNLWLTDAQGNAYTSELRMTAVPGLAGGAR